MRPARSSASWRCFSPWRSSCTWGFACWRPPDHNDYRACGASKWGTCLRRVLDSVCLVEPLMTHAVQPGLQLLIVEDDETLREALSKRFARQGMRVLAAAG